MALKLLVTKMPLFLVKVQLYVGLFFCLRVMLYVVSLPFPGESVLTPCAVGDRVYLLGIRF